MSRPHLTPDEWLSRLEHQVLSAFRELRGLYEQERARREELEHAYRRLRDLDELKTSFIARASAELRQPLGLVIGFLEAALGHLKARGDAESVRMIQAALRGAYRLLDYVAPLAAFAELHRQPIAFVEPIPLGQLIQDLIRVHEPVMSEKSVELHIHLPPEAAQTAVDGPYGSYILRTLLDFLLAIHPEGGRMEIRGHVKEPVLLVEILDPHLSLSREILAWLNEGAVEGLYPQQTRSHVDPAILGLVIAKRAAQALGGDLFIRSEEEQGTTLSVLLPARPLDIEDQISLLSQALERLPSQRMREEGGD
ncbi:Sensor histidine kinase TodS [Candidatus Thermoflexus japonica]|uniref:histidine kinase n=1 Tax=Candidatus Thermoflexus japonica TaxID=2035417 RepID=A0A2H5Y4I0_9CHLR|nr:Sensor histidine kinase TodS [Candidatus Thermoflexus japonica]